VFGLLVVLQTGSETGPRIATAEIRGRRAVSPGYAGAAPPELHHSMGRCSSGLRPHLHNELRSIAKSWALPCNDKRAPRKISYRKTYFSSQG
jgi:phosphatidylethanolamine-binding protein (PEBP) family uncharacterized protein